MSVTSKTVSVTAADGGVFNAYLALPEGGRGPALVLLQEIFGVNRYLREVADRYAEEGYVVIAPDLFWRIQPGIELGYSEAEIKAAFDFFARFDPDQAIKDVADTVRALRAMPECDGKVGAVGFCLGGMLAYLTAARCNIEAAVSYYGVGIEKRLNEVGAVRCPLMLHFGEQDGSCRPPRARRSPRPSRIAKGSRFTSIRAPITRSTTPMRPSYDRFAASLAHSRTIGMLRHAIGPRFDLSALWERHADLEFKYRDADATMTTMVDRPYVNHVPTMTGGVGQQELYRFYKNHFIPKLPRDTKFIPVSRTVGADRVVDEISALLHPRHRDRLSSPRRRANRQVRRDSDRGDRAVPRRQARARAYSLGPGDRAGPAGPARSEKPAHGRTRDRRETARRDAAVEYADETLER